MTTTRRAPLNAEVERARPVAAEVGLQSRLRSTSGTAPASAPPSGPRRRPAVAAAALAWRQLTSMRTALLLLFLLAVAAVPGSLLPQRAVNPLRVQQFLSEHRTVGPVLDRLSGFAVFASPWFSAIYVLLMVSLVGCVLPRLRQHARSMLRRPPTAPAHPSRLPGGVAFTTSASPDEVLEAGQRLLRRSRYRMVLTRPSAADGAVAAEKGYLRETGNLLFHASLIVLLVGVALGSLFGYSGSVLIVEGRSFANTRIAYDSFVPGARVDSGRLDPFSFRLADFSTRYRPSGLPSDFLAQIAVTAGAAAARPVAVRVNEPLRLGRTKVYLTGHGYAPRFVLRDRQGRVLFDDYVPCTPRGASTEPATSSCTVKVPDPGLPVAGPRRVPQQLAFRAGLDADPAGGTAQLHQPRLVLSSFVGDLHLNDGVPQNVYSLDMTGLTPVRTTGPGGREQLVQPLQLFDSAANTVTGLPGGLSLTVPEVRDWAVFAVKHDPGKQLVLLASVLLLMGLMATLGLRRRRIWIRARRAGSSGVGSTIVEIGGVTRTGELTDDANELAQRLRRRLPEESAHVDSE